MSAWLEPLSYGAFVAEPLAPLLLWFPPLGVPLAAVLILQSYLDASAESGPPR